MYNLEVIDLMSLSRYFPNEIEDEIYRDNILDTIKIKFDNEDSIIILESEPGWGKTTVLKQFCNKYPNAISLFIKGTIRYSYDTKALQVDLCNQINWIFISKGAFRRRNQ